MSRLQPSDRVFVKGFGIANYRSFGPQMQYLCPLSSLNVFVGKNNVGKSNVLRAVKLFTEVAKKKTVSLDPFYDSHKSGLAKVAFPVPETFFDTLKSNASGDTDFTSLLLTLKEKWHSLDGLGLSCVVAATFESNDRNLSRFSVCTEYAKAISSLLATANVAEKDFCAVTVELLGGAGPDLGTNVKKFGERMVRDCLMKLPKVRVVDAMRAFVVRAEDKVRPKKQPQSQSLDQLGTFTGEEVLGHLFEIQEPRARDTENHGKLYRRFLNFVRDVLGEEDCEVRVAHDKKEVKVNIKGKTFPLSNWGTGVHQLILLAAAVTYYEQEIILIEEPETNVHPTLQRRFLQYLLESTSNQYFITTHSPAVIDFPEANLFHIFFDQDDCTQIRHVRSSEARHMAIVDMGYRASDLLQANCIIWVEGPSDRVYLNGLIALQGPQLREGVHYSILFYGGANLAHLSALEEDDPQLKSLISVVRINRNSCFVCDSDRESEESQLKPAVQRLHSEFGSAPKRLWLTKGREFENYIPRETREAAFVEVHPKSKYRDDLDPIYGDVTKNDAGRDFDKVRIAQEVVKVLSEVPNSLDLRTRIEGLVDFIQTCNGMNQP